MSLIKDIVNGFWNLLLGLFTTGKYLPKKSVTLQYPTQRWTMPERSRGVVVLLSDPETGELNCTACLICMKQCPISAISITQEKDEAGKRFPGEFKIDNTICCFCGICEEVCNFDGIKLTGKYEFSVFNKEELIYDKARLQELGRDVKYEPKKKRKDRPSAKSAESSKDATRQIPEAKQVNPDQKKPETRSADNDEEGTA
jgi:NADH-quinone oxidoreductase subunit I